MLREHDELKEKVVQETFENINSTNEKDISISSLN